MGETTTRVTGLAATLAYAALVGWLYARQPQTIAQVTGGLSDVVGVYAIDRLAYDDGVQFFHRDRFVEARMAFARADPAERDARTQFYIAYSFYRQGWGRLYHDDALYRQGLEAVDRALMLAPGGRLLVDDAGISIHRPEELKAELEAGRRYDVSDLNPMRLFRERR